MITDTGLEGGPIYALGPALRAGLAESGQVTLMLDMHPDVDPGRLAERLASRRPKASVTSWLGSAGISKLAIAMARETTHNSLPETPTEMARLLKQLPIQIGAMQPIERAISSAGGVAFDSLDANWMLLDRPGTFVAGEMVDWEAPTGGYLLQACFSSGVAAANGMLTWCEGDQPN